MNIKIILVMNPYLSMRNPQTQELFAKMMDMKIFAYRNHYTQTVIPFSHDDFISDYAFICLESEKGMTPLWSFKYLDFDRCKKYVVEFPPFEYLKHDHPEDFQRLVDDVRKSQELKRSVGYVGAMIRNQRFDHSSLPEGYHAVGYGVFAHMIERLGFKDIYAIGTIRNRSSQLMSNAGFEHYIKNPIKLHYYDNVDAHFDCAKIEVVSEKTNFAKRAIQNLWNARIEIIEEDEVASLKIAA